MKIFITGGTGFIGSYITERLSGEGHEVMVLSRSAEKAGRFSEGVALVEGDPKKPGMWQQRVPDNDVVINLAGSSIFTLWTKKARRGIMESRVSTTRNLVDALRKGSGKSVLISASAVGYYGSRLDDAMLDETSPPGDDFPAQIAMNWESEARRAEEFGVRVVLCRFGIVLGRNGGALAKMLPAFRYFLASPLGSGKQWFPWIHIEDLLRIMLFLSEKNSIFGPVNCTAPHPVRNEDMTRVLADVLNRPLIMPSVPSFVLKTALGEFGSMLLKGQRAIPARLLDEGFRFLFPTFRGAVEDLVS